MQRWLVSMVLIGVLLAVGMGLQGWLIETAPEAARTDAARPPLRVDGIVVQPVTKREPLVGYGTVLSQKTAMVTSQVGGEVIERARTLRVGTRVAAGTVLLQIDTRDFAQQLARAESQLRADEATLSQLDQEATNVERLIGIASSELAIAEREYARILQLFEQNQSPQRELDLARQSLEASRRAVQTLENTRDLLGPRRATIEAALGLRNADVELARLNLERCTLKAPFDGRIEAVSVEAGERVAPGQALFAILDPDDLEIPVELSVSLRDRVQVGTTSRITTESRSDIVWEGRVARIAPSARPETRTFSAFLEVDRQTIEQPLLPGMFVRVALQGPAMEDVLVVPRGSIVDGQVFTVEDGLARPRPVSVTRHLRGESIVTGIEPGTQVIVSNLDVLFDGCAVELHEAAPTRPSNPQASGVEVAGEPQQGT